VYEKTRNNYIQKQDEPKVTVNASSLDRQKGIMILASAAYLMFPTK
jgi:hypothetical protein